MKLNHQEQMILSTLHRMSGEARDLLSEDATFGLDHAMEVAAIEYAIVLVRREAERKAGKIA